MLKKKVEVDRIGIRYRLIFWSFEAALAQISN